MEKMLLIKGGHVWHPDSQTHGSQDIVIDVDGTVRSIFPSGQEPGLAPGSYDILDAADCWVTPGLVDLHAHVFQYVTEFSLDADEVGVSSGVTTVVDGGSAGVLSLPAFAKLIAPSVHTKVFAFVDVSLIYLGDLKFTSHRVGLPNHPYNFSVDRLVEAVSTYPRLVKGFKVRATRPSGSHDVPLAMQTAKAAQAEHPVPIMVHLGKFPYADFPDTGELLGMLGPGDLVTHAFRGGSYGLLDREMRVRPEVVEARERGVLLDVGQEHSLHFGVIRNLLDQGILPDTLSTDLAVNTLHLPDPMLLDLMTKFLALGMEFMDVLRTVTTRPAQILGRTDLAQIRVGSKANLSILNRVVPDIGQARLQDGYGQTVTYPWRLAPNATVIGRVVFQPSSS